MLPERERLILCKKSTTPGMAEIKKAQEITKTQALERIQSGKFVRDKSGSSENRPVISTEKSSSGSAVSISTGISGSRMKKLEEFFGEMPTITSNYPPMNLP